MAADGMTRKITIRKSVTIADPVSQTTRIQLSVAAAENIQREIFVMRYTPANAYRNRPVMEFNNVAYADELNYPTTAGKEAGYVLVSSFCMDFASPKDCENWLRPVVRDIQRLLTELETLDRPNGEADYFDVTADAVVCDVPSPDPEPPEESSDASTVCASSTSSSISSGSSESSNNAEEPDAPVFVDARDMILG